MNSDAESRLEDIASAFRWIVENSYPTHPKQKPHTVRIIVGRDKIEERECGANENIVSVSESGIYFWFRPYSEPGAPRFSAQKMNGLFDFMRVVIWPRVIGDWCADRLLGEANLQGVERLAVDEYERLQSEQKSLALKDIDSLLAESPNLQGLYSAIRSSNSEILHKYSVDLPGELGAIGHEQIQVLVQAIAEADDEKIKSHKSYLIFRVLHIAAEPLLAAGRFDWQSQEYHQAVKKSHEQIKLIGRLARKRYAKEFMAFCLSEEMLDIGRRLFAGAADVGADSYRVAVTNFVEDKLASFEYAA